MAKFLCLVVQDPKYRSRRTIKYISHRRITAFQHALFPLFSAVMAGNSLKQPSGQLLLRHLLSASLKGGGWFEESLVWNIFNEMETYIHLIDAASIDAVMVFNTLYDLFGEAACMGARIQYSDIEVPVYA